MLDFIKKNKKKHIEIEIRMPSGRLVRRRVAVAEGEFLDAILETEQIVSNTLRREFEGDECGC